MEWTIRNETRKKCTQEILNYFLRNYYFLNKRTSVRKWHEQFGVTQCAYVVTVWPVVTTCSRSLKSCVVRSAMSDCLRACINQANQPLRQAVLPWIGAVNGTKIIWASYPWFLRWNRQGISAGCLCRRKGLAQFSSVQFFRSSLHTGFVKLVYTYRSVVFLCSAWEFGLIISQCHNSRLPYVC